MMQKRKSEIDLQRQKDYIDGMVKLREEPEIAGKLEKFLADEFSA